MTTTADNPPTTAPPGAVCRRCWHGLKGLSTTSVCPECGESIGAGMDPLWWGTKPIDAIKRARRWLTLTAWAMPISIGLFVTSGALSERGTPGTLTNLDVVAKLLEISAAFALLVGIWLGVGALLPLALAPRWAAVAARCAALPTVFMSIITSLLEADPARSPSLLQAATIAYGFSLLSVLLLWSIAICIAANAVGVKTLRVWSLLQLTAVSLIALCWVPMLMYTIVLATKSVPGRWLMEAIGYIAYAAFPLSLVLAVSLITNPPLFRNALRRFIEARLGAG